MTGFAFSRDLSGIWEARGLETAKVGSRAGRDAVVVSKVPGSGGQVVKGEVHSRNPKQHVQRLEM